MVVMVQREVAQNMAAEATAQVYTDEARAYHGLNRPPRARWA